MCGLAVLVTEQRLNDANIRSAFEQMGGEAMAQVTASGAKAVTFQANAVADSLEQRGRGKCASGMLRLQSYACPSKLFTANQKLIVSIEKTLKPEKLIEIRQAIIDILSR